MKEFKAKFPPQPIIVECDGKTYGIDPSFLKMPEMKVEFPKLDNNSEFLKVRFRNIWDLGVKLSVPRAVIFASDFGGSSESWNKWVKQQKELHRLNCIAGSKKGSHRKKYYRSLNRR